MTSLPRRVVAGLAFALVLTGCSGNDSDGPRVATAEPSSEAPGADGPEVRTDDSDDFADQSYVAMGDSYTAAPGVQPADDSSGLCGRSEVNYPHLVQGAFGGSELADVSCSGATTADLLAPQQLSTGAVPAQIDAVTADTDIVTISTGGNDFGAFALLAGDCVQTGCEDIDIAAVQAGLAQLSTDLAGAIEQVQERAPEARVLVVGYPQVVPAGNEGCDDVPLDAQTIGLARLLNQELSNAQKRAAETAGVEFVDLYAATQGHALCSDEPWINGGDTTGAVPYHPLESGQRAAAAAIVELLDS
ncbi:MAG: SGNH/GDSL hydrolase family protein [Nocardioides alkalitolerans]